MKRKLGILTLTTLTLLGAGLVLAPAHAGHKHKKHHSVHRPHHGHAPHAVHPRHGRITIGYERHRSFAVPRHIHRKASGPYRPYYADRSYFRPHRHYHAVYYFPVRARAGMIWQPHYYCNGNLFTGQFDYYGPRVSFQARF